MEKASFKHHFLIAMPTIDDLDFEKTVIYLCEHTPEGAMGLIINRPLDAHLHDIWDELEIPYPKDSLIADLPVFDGGPLNKSRGFVLYSPLPPERSPNHAVQLTPELFITTSTEMLRILASDHAPTQVFLALGYTAWGPGQLDREILENVWLCTPAHLPILFESAPYHRLSESANLIGVDLEALSLEVGHA